MLFELMLLMLMLLLLLLSLMLCLLILVLDACTLRERVGRQGRQFHPHGLK